VLAAIPPHADPTNESMVSWMQSSKSGESNLDEEDTVHLPKR